MRAIQVVAFGGPEVLQTREVPAPVAGPGQVVIGLRAADVIFLDTLLRGGWGLDYFPRTPPYTPGGGGAGHVLSTGDGVDPGWVGRHVVARASGAYAEQVVADAGDLVEIPAGLGSETAAALVHDGVTALSLLGDTKIAESERVLVAAAAGGAGSLLVQLAREAGAHAVAAARGERKLALARELGAAEVVDYSKPGWQHTIRPVDVAFDGAGGPLGAAVFDTVAEGGRFVTYGTSDGFADIDPDLAERRRVQVRDAIADAPPDQATVRELLGEALTRTARGRLRPAIGATYPLDHAADAHTALAERTTVGKSLLTVQP